jgi:hypothetical protein
VTVAEMQARRDRLAAQVETTARLANAQWARCRHNQEVSDRAAEAWHATSAAWRADYAELQRLDAELAQRTTEGHPA